jgi:para-aminobenzoate synthetase component 1
LRSERRVSLLLDGSGEFEDGWDPGPLLAVEPRCVLHRPPGKSGAADTTTLSSIDSLLRRRRKRGGTRETGVAVLLAYEALDRHDRASELPVPRIAVFQVDRSLRFLAGGQALHTHRCGRETTAGLRDESRPRLDTLAGEVGRAAGGRSPARIVGRPATSLPRESYLQAVQRIKRHITDGDVYQANLCQRFSADYQGDECAFYAELARRTPAPRSAFVETPDFALASVSPEFFLRVRNPDRIETWPIKGTRARCRSRVEDLRARRELLESSKDRAELLMIVDLERNDLGRVCVTGSVRVRQLAELRSFAEVHHLVGCVEGSLRPGVGTDDLLRATFPGGSISGAPKIRARQILSEIEPVERGFFTGSLCWFGDDGSMDSSILIRSVVFAGGRVSIGAGGGIVADSDPEQEWLESMHKARAPAATLGLDVEETI